MAARSSRKGVALLATLFIVLVLYFLVTVSLFRGDMVLNATSRSRQKLQNEYLAQAGLHKMIEQVNLDPNWVAHHLQGASAPAEVIPAQAQEVRLTAATPPIYLWAEPGASGQSYALVSQCGKGSVAQRRRAQVNLADEIVPVLVSSQDNPSGIVNLKSYSYQTQSWNTLTPPLSMLWNGAQPALETASGNPVYVPEVLGGCADTEGNLYVVVNRFVYRCHLADQKWYLLPSFGLSGDYRIGGLCLLDGKLCAAVNLPTTEIQGPGQLLSLEHPEQQGQTYDPGSNSWSAPASPQAWQTVAAFPALRASEIPTYSSLIGQIPSQARYPFPMSAVCAGGGFVYLSRSPATAPSSLPHFWCWDGQQWALLPDCPAQYFHLNQGQLALMDDRPSTHFSLTGIQADAEGQLYTAMTPYGRDQLEVPALYKFEPSGLEGGQLQGIWKAAGLACQDAPSVSQPQSFLTVQGLAGNGQSLMVEVHAGQLTDPEYPTSSDDISQSQLLYRVDTGPIDSQPGQSLSLPDGRRPVQRGASLVYEPGGANSELQIIAVGGHKTGRKVARVISWY